MQLSAIVSFIHCYLLQPGIFTADRHLWIVRGKWYLQSDALELIVEVCVGFIDRFVLEYVTTKGS